MSRVRQRWGRVAGFWCAIMHNDMSWPIHGHYFCRKCRRTYSVPWN